VAVWQATFEFDTAAGFPTDFRARLGRIAPPLTSWSDDLEMWGTEEGDRVDVWTEGGRPVEARVRFDMRESSEAFCLAVCRFADAGVR
jgi:hypothetical protein